MSNLLAQRYELALARASVLAVLEHRELTEAEIEAELDEVTAKIESEYWSVPEGGER